MHVFIFAWLRIPMRPKCCLLAVRCYRMRVNQHWCCWADFSDMKPTSQGFSSTLCMDMNERVWSITISLFSDSTSREEGFSAAGLRVCVCVCKTHICVYHCTSVYVLTSVDINIIECCVKERWPLEISRRVETHALSSHHIDCDTIKAFPHSIRCHYIPFPKQFIHIA